MPCERIKPSPDWLTFADVVNRGVHYAQIVSLRCRGWVTFDAPVLAGLTRQMDQFRLNQISPDSMAIYVPV
jgi:hypothetical protein